jgi:hypothetical protein
VVWSSNGDEQMVWTSPFIAMHQWFKSGGSGMSRTIGLLLNDDELAPLQDIWERIGGETINLNAHHDRCRVTGTAVTLEQRMVGSTTVCTRWGIGRGARR